jgi:hypothetical protein
MHRSGTSCLTGIMQGLGVELGEVFTENLYNKRGNRENSRIVILNDAVLNTNKGAWNRPVVVSEWTPEQAHERDSIIRELERRETVHWGFKDTRTLFTLPFWLEIIESPLFIAEQSRSKPGGRRLGTLARLQRTAAGARSALWLRAD